MPIFAATIYKGKEILRLRRRLSVSVGAELILRLLLRLHLHFIPNKAQRNVAIEGERAMAKLNVTLHY